MDHEVVNSDHHGAVEGPLLFALLLNNQNNNNNPNKNPGGLANAAIPDSLTTQTAALELLYDNKVVNSQIDVEAQYPDHNGAVEGPMLLVFINTQRNNNPGGRAEWAPGTGAAPIPDSLATQTVARELLYGNNAAMRCEGVVRIHGAVADPTAEVDIHQLQSWRENGFLVIPEVLSKETLSILVQSTRETAEELIKGGDAVRVHSVFNEKQENSYVSPCGRLMAGVEPETFGDTTLTALQRISRLGCGIHRILPAFRSITFSRFHHQLSRSLGLLDPRVTQSQIITKASVVGQRILPHQDGCTVFTDPPSCVTFWYALEDSTLENGCLAVAPGSHREEPLRRRCKRDQMGRAEFENLETPVFSKVDGVDDSTRSRRGPDGSYIYQKLEVKAGTLILMHGNLMHMSEANRSGKSRIAYVFGVVEGGLEWLADNYLQPYDGEKEFEQLIPQVQGDQVS